MDGLEAESVLEVTEATAVGGKDSLKREGGARWKGQKWVGVARWNGQKRLGVAR